MSNTSEVIFGALIGGLFLSDPDDTLIHEPIFAIEEGQINTPTYTSTSTDSETASARPPSPASELLHVTVKFHRVTLLDDLIAQFKDEAMMTYSVKYSFVDEMAQMLMVCPGMYTLPCGRNS